MTHGQTAGADRALFEITGADAAHFLQGLISNDIARAKGALCYAALLTPQGKYLADFFLTALPNGYLLDVDAAIAPMLVQRLGMYKLRADVTIAPSNLHVSRGTGPAPQGALPDPRNAALGWRLYGEAALPEDGTDWLDRYVTHIIPQTGIELTPDSYLLEVGFERLSGVDFRKGCYVGQEVTARMKHKTELRKGLVQVAIDGTAPIGTPILAGEKEAGTLYSQSGGRALAYLRFDRIGADMTADGARITPQP